MILTCFKTSLRDLLDGVTGLLADQCDPTGCKSISCLLIFVKLNLFGSNFWLIFWISCGFRLSVNLSGFNWNKNVNKFELQYRQREKKSSQAKFSNMSFQRTHKAIKDRGADSKSQQESVFFFLNKAKLIYWTYLPVLFFLKHTCCCFFCGSIKSINNEK